MSHSPFMDPISMRHSAVLTAPSFVGKLRETTTSSEKPSTTATSNSSDSGSSRTLAHRPRRSFVKVATRVARVPLFKKRTYPGGRVRRLGNLERGRGFRERDRHRALWAHDLRRTCAKLCRKIGGDLEQIKFLLGHSSIQTTERYLGSEQEIVISVNDNLGL